jgi:hypothetical protein
MGRCGGAGRGRSHTHAHEAAAMEPVGGSGCLGGVGRHTSVGEPSDSILSIPTLPYNVIRWFATSCCSPIICKNSLENFFFSI